MYLREAEQKVEGKWRGVAERVKVGAVTGEWWW
jgi:hypothetical protein